MRKLLAVLFAALATAGVGAGVASAFPNGTYSVPTEFEPGTYRVYAGEGSGYVEACANYRCSYVYGVSHNAYLEPGTNAYFVVSEDAAYVTTRDVDIYRVQ